MIPKIIHYCWFGGNPLPEEYKKYIDSWKKYCPDYEIKEWNEENFDIDCCPYVREAYKAKMWAFVSDYARFWILYRYGGLYFDTDVEILKPIDVIIQKGAFMGIEKDSEASVNPGLGLCSEVGMEVYKEILEFYAQLHFIDEDGYQNKTTVVKYTTDILKNNGLVNTNKIQKVNDIYIYPQEYFNPKNYDTGLIKITDNTYSIHHFSTSWASEKDKRWKERSRWFIRKFGEKSGYRLYRISNFPYRVKKKIHQKGIVGTLKFIWKKLENVG